MLALKIFGVTRTRIVMCARKLWWVSIAYKIFRSQRPLWAEI